jgi:hypothetical protein
MQMIMTVLVGKSKQKNLNFFKNQQAHTSIVMDQQFLKGADKRPKGGT